MQQQQQQQQQPFNGCYTASPVKNWKDFVGVEFYCPHALADGNQGILVRRKPWSSHQQCCLHYLRTLT